MNTYGVPVFILVLLAGTYSGLAESAPSESLLVMNRPGSDVAQFRERLSRRGLEVLRESRCNTQRYSVFEVRPKRGTADAALKALHAVKDADLEAAERKFESSVSACTPDINDPKLHVEWQLDAMNFGEMVCLLDAHGVKQIERPRMTLIDSGIVLIKKELAKGQIREFNFTGGANGVEETTFSDESSIHHGTAVACVGACTTNNRKSLASAASFNKSVLITMCRTSENDAIDTIDVIDAMNWCVDHQDLRGGRGVINLSINSTAPPTYNGSSVVQAIAKAAAKQGDLFVNGAGNTNYHDESAVTKNFRVVAGLEDTLLRWDEGPGIGSNYGAFKAAAPAVSVPLLNGTGKTVLYGTGTSFAAPCWASCISLLMSLDPGLSAPQADKIVFQTATVTTEEYHLPDLRAAVNAALALEP